MYSVKTLISKSRREKSRKGAEGIVTSFMGYMAERRMPKPLLKPFLKFYIRRFKIDMSEYTDDLNLFLSFNSFFTRGFKSGMRSFSEDGIASPAEGMLISGGLIEEGQLFHVKGKSYPVERLLDKKVSFKNGSFATIYLSPADYHRVHAPFNCTIKSIRHLPGKLKTVNPRCLKKDDLLYCKNERVILEGSSSFGNFYIVMIGAIVVGKIKLSILPEFGVGFNSQDISIDIEKGQELGCFELGSTVVLILENDQLQDVFDLTGRRVKLGENIGV